MDIAPGLWLIILTVGIVALGMVMLTAQIRTKNRTPAEKANTEAATRAEYRREDED